MLIRISLCDIIILASVGEITLLIESENIQFLRSEKLLLPLTAFCGPSRAYAFASSPGLRFAARHISVYHFLKATDTHGNTIHLGHHLFALTNAAFH